MTSVGDSSKRSANGKGGRWQRSRRNSVSRNATSRDRTGRLEGLPGSFFYKSFVKAVRGSVLGVDETLLRAGIEALTATLEPVPRRADPQKVPNGGNGNHFAVRIIFRRARPVRR